MYINVFQYEHVYIHRWMPLYPLSVVYLILCVFNYKRTSEWQRRISCTHNKTENENGKEEEVEWKKLFIHLNWLNSSLHMKRYESTYWRWLLYSVGSYAGLWAASHLSISCEYIHKHKLHEKSVHGVIIQMFSLNDIMHSFTPLHLGDWNIQQHHKPVLQRIIQSANEWIIEFIMFILRLDLSISELHNCSHLITSLACCNWLAKG